MRMIDRGRTIDTNSLESGKSHRSNLAEILDAGAIAPCLSAQADRMLDR